MSVCPCRITPPSVSTQDSSASYEDCCQPYHESLAAPDAERLMRSRYSAFVLQLPDYIVKTTVPAQQALLDSCLLYTSPSPRDRQKSRMPSSA